MEGQLSFSFSKLTKRFIMTDVNVQFFSHLNGLTLGNNWGDLIRLLDTCLVNGKPLPSIILQSVEPDTGDITLEFSANHSCLQLQIIELTGFTPSEINGKYRIKGIPNATSLILKSDLRDVSITGVGLSKLASLDYEIIFRDDADVKRVYRAKDPSHIHPFIRVDESLTSEDGVTGVYNTSYAKYAMVSLIENMSHIDDYLDFDKLQLPYNSTNLSRNFNITGTNTACVRGYSKWYWARASGAYNSTTDTTSPPNGNRYFTLVGDKDAFYLLSPFLQTNTDYRRVLKACGLYNPTHAIDNTPPWFLMAHFSQESVSVNFEPDTKTYGNSLSYSVEASKFQVPFLGSQRLSNSVQGIPICHTYDSGYGSINGSSPTAIEYPFYDSNSKLRGTLKHVMYSGNNRGNIVTTPILANTSMYVVDNANTSGSNTAGGFYFYLGEL